MPAGPAERPPDVATCQEVITEEEEVGGAELLCRAVAARWQATNDEEQAVSTVTAGPLSPKVKEIRPLVTDRWAPGKAKIQHVAFHNAQSNEANGNMESGQANPSSSAPVA